MAFIELTVSNQIVWHGYDEHNKELIEEINGQKPAKKTVAISRIQSFTEKYVLVTSGFGRFAYWEYHDGYDSLKSRLAAAGHFVS